MNELNVEQQQTTLFALHRFLPDAEVETLHPYLVADEEGYHKFITGVTLRDGRHVVVKLVREDDGTIEAERDKLECQSAYAEMLRENGIATPRRYRAEGSYCIVLSMAFGKICATAEDWCGNEITTITESLSFRIGALLAKIHTVSVQNGFMIGRGTLFGAAVKNDVNAFDGLCRLAEDEQIDKDVFAAIRALYEQKMCELRTVWEGLPRAATQGDISINNLVDTGDELIVFDFNNAGDETLVSDLVLEGLLTAYEMDLPEGTPPEVPQQLFRAFIRGYRSVRALSDAECAAAWTIYVLYDSLWFTKILYNDDSVQGHLQRGDAEGANRKLKEMLHDLQRTEKDEAFVAFTA